ncbi:MAG: membrane protein insertase YidC [Endomicrobiia bacterium]
MEKRVILATILSTLVIILWFYWTAPKKTTSFKEQSILPKNEIQQKTQSQKEEPKGTDYTIETKFYKIVFNSVGAKIKNWFVDGDDIILQPLDNSYISNNFSTYSEENFKLYKKESNKISFTTIKSDVKITKEYYINDDDFCSINFSFENLSKKDVKFELPIIIGPGIGGTDISERKQENSITKAVLYIKNNKKGKLIKIKPNSEYSYNFNWVALENRYFVISILNNGQIDRVFARRVGSEGLNEVILTTTIGLLSGENKSISLNFYIGPKIYDKLVKLGNGLENVVDFGFFSSLSKLAFFSLKFFYKLTKNYGIAIIIITIIVQLLTLPITIKRYKPTKAMKLLQPKIKELQIKYKDDPKRLNAEIMYLYRSQKVNPLGGCLPMLLQLPIFWALFTTFKNTYELKKAPFVLWIKDLSSPDLLFNFAGFPIRVLPLLMGLSMLVQQKLTGGSSTDPSQKTLSYLMPAIFTVIFWNFPSGLVLYWFTNSILSLGIQFMILKQPTKMEAKSE